MGCWIEFSSLSNTTLTTISVTAMLLWNSQGQGTSELRAAIRPVRTCTSLVVLRSGIFRSAFTFNGLGSILAC
ncbi:hypothetical protein L3X38_022822 [Prunus dulcis]|uniref:Uncharacterized protein n=1 Tax=Prunus dulcis TaxID=3755 RepID=A0AAD4Z5J7_PRUDU|nr:hypothetical protein L3X38_022822 [Prunus dulcis]